MVKIMVTFEAESGAGDERRAQGGFWGARKILFLDMSSGYTSVNSDKSLSYKLRT